MTDWFGDWIETRDGCTIDEFMRRSTPRAKPSIDTGTATVYLDGQFWYDESIVSGGRLTIYCPGDGPHTVQVTSAITTFLGVHDLLRKTETALLPGQALIIDWPNPLCSLTIS